MAVARALEKVRPAVHCGVGTGGMEAWRRRCRPYSSDRRAFSGNESFARIEALTEDGTVIRSPSEVTVSADGTDVLPMSILAEAGMNPGETLLAHRDGDGEIVLRCWLTRSVT